MGRRRAAKSQQQRATSPVRSDPSAGPQESTSATTRAGHDPKMTPEIKATLVPEEYCSSSSDEESPMTWSDNPPQASRQEPMDSARTDEVEILAETTAASHPPPAPDPVWHYGPDTTPSPPVLENFQYPEAVRGLAVDKAFGKEVEDPYRHFEDPESALTKEFIYRQNQLSKPFFHACPYRKRIEEALMRHNNYTKKGCPFKRGRYYYFYKNDGLQKHAVLYQQESLDGPERVFMDPNSFSEDGSISLHQVSFSPDGRFMAYGLSHGGSDWIEIKVRQVMTGADMPDRLERAKFTSIEWTHDDKGFFYARYPDSQRGESRSLRNHSIYYHFLGTSQEGDVLKVRFDQYPKWNLGFEVSKDGKYLHVYPSEGCNDNLWFYCELKDFKPVERLTLKPLYVADQDDPNDYKFDYITEESNIVYFITNYDAPNYRIAKLDLNKPQKQFWEDLIPAHNKDVLLWAETFSTTTGTYFLVNFMCNVSHKLELFDTRGDSVRQFNLPAGSIHKTSGRPLDMEIFFTYTSFLTPSKIYRYDLYKMPDQPELIHETKLDHFDPEEFLIEQKLFESEDGLEVPMYIVRTKKFREDGLNPCILYGYGGFNISLTSAFNVNRLLWLKNYDGVFAVANCRGGGEYGENWHEKGRLLNKMDVFDDFIAAAKYLIKKRYTSSNLLAIEGGSNGGLLVAAAANRRPDLFGAQICHVGVLDMLRYHKFTIGHAWMTEFGNPDKQEDFEYLLKYSPYHNIPDDVDKYPATLLLTGDHDDRVVPAHSLKFIAQLQHKLGKKLPKTPLLIKVDTKSGHGSGKTTQKLIKQYADIYAFLHLVFDLKYYWEDFYPEGTGTSRAT